jgi:hypothetical protein
MRCCNFDVILTRRRSDDTHDTDRTLRTTRIGDWGDLVNTLVVADPIVDGTAPNVKYVNISGSFITHGLAADLT